MNLQDMIKDITSHLTKGMNVDAVFGESRIVGKKTIIPVAVIRFGLGAGGGRGKGRGEAEAPEQDGEGGGAGGGGTARPVAVLEVTDEQTRLIPVVDTTRVILASLTLAGVTTFLITRLLSKRRK